MDIYSLLEKVKMTLRPDTAAIAQITAFVEEINAAIKAKGYDADCIIGGSVGKGTMLKDDFDVDLFVRFDYSYKDKDISVMLNKILDHLNPTLIHGSRDYFQIQKNFTYEIIPVLNITDYKKVKNVTDMSPLHVTYVKDNLKKKPSLADDIRLAKQFCKASTCYGAESYISGFSGHVLDILVIHYGSFLNFLSAAAEWKAKKVIDPELHLEDPEKELNKAKQQSPLILVDPLQPDRNAAAALSQEKYDMIRQTARAFLENPAEEYFQQKKVDSAYLLQRKKIHKNSLLAVIHITPLEDKKDISGSKALKAYEHIKKEMHANGFVILEDGWRFHPSHTLFYFIVNSIPLPPLEEQEGPPTKNKRHYKEFITKHNTDKLYIKNKRVFAYVKRKYTTIEEFLNAKVVTAYVKERIKKVEKVEFL
jgi:tRNA nucleotidyltransferase (CCA-adding enzyme)